MRKHRTTIFLYLLFSILFLLFYLSQPSPLFEDPTSTVLLDRNGELMGARLAADQQWRFPETDTVPYKFRRAIIAYEDRYFPFHFGINPVSVYKALFQNIRHGRVVTGASTITMQVIRLSRKNQPRTIFEKIIELYLALRLELTSSKSEILALYASHAPFGGNVVGLDAAAWRYFGTDAAHLSWGEAATLAVLPNSPAMIFPGRNHVYLEIKRNRLLDRLCKQGIIDQTTCELAKSENLPNKPLPLPQFAQQLLNEVIRDGYKGALVRSSLRKELQGRVAAILAYHQLGLEANQIHNAAAVVIEVENGNAIAYLGNLSGSKEHGNDVDIIRSPRSTGSVMKPLLYAGMLNDGLLLPTTLVPDIPTRIGGFMPENYNLTYDGAVPAKQALSRSLNIPAVKMLQNYGYDQFYSLLRNLGLTTLTKPASHYGLTLVLGGAEATLWDLTGIYASMARTLNHYSVTKMYSKSDFHTPGYLLPPETKAISYNEPKSWLDAASIWLTFDAMVEVSRPDEEVQWRQFSSSRKIAWKTGTSFGNRDAWSIGVTPEYIVGVWVGNASGEGRPSLTGINVAAPILFDIFKALPAGTWFQEPRDAMVEVAVCRNSGYRASTICTEVDSLWIPKNGAKTEMCPFHKLIHLDQTGKYQVNATCESPANMQHVSWFVLPPVQEWYFRSKNPFYKPLPPFRPDCAPNAEVRNMDMIYPKNNSILYIPVELDGTPGSTIFKLAHRDQKAVVYWHLDERYLGSTVAPHQFSIAPAIGKHRLSLIDQNGETLVVRFEVLKKTELN